MTTTLAKKLTVAAIILALALAVFSRQTSAATRTRAELEALRVEVARLQPRVAGLDREAETAEAAMRDHRAALARLGAGPVATNSPAASGEASAAGAGLGGAREWVELNKANLAGLSLKPFTEDFRVSDEAAAILDLNEKERQSLDQAFRRVIEKHQQLDLARVTKAEGHLSQEPGHKTTFRVSAYPDEGKLMAKEVMGATESAIGSTRAQTLFGYADLNSLSADGFEPFGRTEKTITFVDRENPDGSRGDCRIFMKVVDLSTGFTLTTSYANTDDAIPKNWRHLIENIAPPRQGE